MPRQLPSQGLDLIGGLMVPCGQALVRCLELKPFALTGGEPALNHSEPSDQAADHSDHKEATGLVQNRLTDWRLSFHAG